ncbi:MAG: hypothetical protein ACTHLZ_12650 [Tepidisphaeraceae bacterium]
MPTKSSTPSTSHNLSDLKPGSRPEDAAHVGGRGDFGVKENDVAERTYTSENTKHADRGAAQPMSYEHDGRRQSGAGGHDSGPGSSSGGDIDTDFVGLGGSGLAADIPTAVGTGADETDGSSRAAASGRPAKGQNETLVGKVGGAKPQVNVVTPPDVRTRDTSSDEASHAEEDNIDDSFRGEISSSEADGRDDAGV